MKIAKWMLMAGTYIVLFGGFVYSDVLYEKRYDTVILLFWNIVSTAYIIRELKNDVSEPITNQYVPVPSAAEILGNINAQAPTPAPTPVVLLQQDKAYNLLEQYVVTKRDEGYGLLEIGQSLTTQGYLPDTVNELISNLLASGRIQLDDPVIDATVKKKPKKK